MIADFLQIENFFSTFKEELETVMGNFPKDVRKSFLYVAMVNYLLNFRIAKLLMKFIQAWFSPC